MKATRGGVSLVYDPDQEYELFARRYEVEAEFDARAVDDQIEFHPL
ncbi:MAG: hypothetical protein OXG26_01630 [Caldilineaceae bacterium]|nr:hypothetical protein [Caldilineaceae bacterium]MDE0634192.1 hypothetical protein [Caldilineaceae bacterium]